MKMLPEHTHGPEWDIDLRDSIYTHLRVSWRLRTTNPDDALWHLNEAITLLHVAHCPSDAAWRKQMGVDRED